MSQEYAIAFTVIGFVLIFFSLVFGSLSRLIGILDRGEILLDCGPDPKCGRYLFVAIVNGAVFLMFLSNPDAIEYLGLAAIAPGLIFVISMINMMGTLKITENGIWRYSSLLRWENIESYEWLEGAESTLTLRTKTDLLSSGNVVLAFPAEQKEAVSKLLAQYLPQKETSPGIGTEEG